MREEEEVKRPNFGRSNTIVRVFSAKVLYLHFVFIFQHLWPLILGVYYFCCGSSLRYVSKFFIVSNKILV